MSSFKLPELPIPEPLRRPLKWVGYPLFALLVFVLSLYASLPRERIQDQLLALASEWLGAEVKTSEFGLTLIPGVTASGITVTARQPPGVAPPLGPDGKPQKPAHVLIDDARVRFGLVRMLRGFTDVSWKGHVAQGEVAGKFASVPEEGRLELDLSEVQLKAFPMLPGMIGIPGVPIEGQVMLKGEVVAPQNLLAQSDGSFQLTINNAVLGDGKSKVTIPNTPLAGGLTLPKVSLGKIAGDAAITKGRAQLHDLKAHSPDIDIEVEGYIELKDPIGQSQLHLYVKLKPSEALIKREAGLEAMVNLGGAAARRADGYFGLTVEGSPNLPRVLPAPNTPLWLNAKPTPVVPPKVAGSPLPPPPPPPPQPLSPRITPPTPPRFDPSSVPLPPSPVMVPPPLPPPPTPPPGEPTMTPSMSAPAPGTATAPSLPEPVNAVPPPRLGVSRGFGAGTVAPPPVSDEARTTESPTETPPPQ